MYSNYRLPAATRWNRYRSRDRHAIVSTHRSVCFFARTVMSCWRSGTASRVPSSAAPARLSGFIMTTSCRATPRTHWQRSRCWWTMRAILSITSSAHGTGLTVHLMRIFGLYNGSGLPRTRPIRVAGRRRSSIERFFFAAANSAATPSGLPSRLKQGNTHCLMIRSVMTCHRESVRSIAYSVSPTGWRFITRRRHISRCVSRTCSRS